MANFSERITKKRDELGLLPLLTKRYGFNDNISGLKRHVFDCRSKETLRLIQSIRDQIQWPVSSNPFIAIIRFFQGWWHKATLEKLDTFSEFFKHEANKVNQAFLHDKTGVYWESEDQRKSEWSYAKSVLIKDGQLLPDGTKLSRTDPKHKERVTHSFEVFGGKIFAIAPKYHSFSNQGVQAVVKAAETEDKKRWVRKCAIPNEEVRGLDRLSLETKITKRVFPNAVGGERLGEGTKMKYSLYMPNQGQPLASYMTKNARDISLEKRFDLAIDILRSLKDFLNPEDGIWHIHGDAKMDHILVDSEGKPHIIDFGLASEHLFQDFDILKRRAEDIDCFMRDIINACFYAPDMVSADKEKIQDRKSVV